MVISGGNRKKVATMTARIGTGHHFAPSRPLSPFSVGWTGKPSADGMYGEAKRIAPQETPPRRRSGTPGQNSEVLPSIWTHVWQQGHPLNLHQQGFSDWYPTADPFVLNCGTIRKKKTKGTFGIAGLLFRVDQRCKRKASSSEGHPQKSENSGTIVGGYTF